MQRKRLSNLRKISPFVSYKFPSLERPENHPLNSSSDKKRSIHTPAQDPIRLHYALENMRKSERYLKRPKTFDKKFLKHLEKTGYDETGIIVRREFYNNKKKQMRKFGSFEDSVIDYPDVIKRGKRVEEVIEDDIRIESNHLINFLDHEKNSEIEKKIKEKKTPKKIIKEPKKEIDNEIINISDFAKKMKKLKPLKSSKIRKKSVKGGPELLTKYLKERKKINENKAIKQKFKERNKKFRSHSLEYTPLPSKRGDLIVNPNNPEILKFKQRVVPPHNPLKEFKVRDLGKKRIKSLRSRRGKKSNKTDFGKTEGSIFHKTGGMFRDQMKLMRFQSYWDVDPSSINSSIE